MKSSNILHNSLIMNGQLSKNGKKSDSASTLSGQQDEKLLEIILGNQRSAIDTPLRKDAFEMSNEEKIARIAEYMGKIMQTLGLDLTDESLRDTPMRVAKMYVRETFMGLDPANKPEATLFSNSYNYSQMLVEKDITIYSTCEHHLVPIIGKAHVAYFSNDHVIGLSKLNRIADYYARRPQVQERLTIQIAEALKEILKTDDVAVMIDASHLCVASRGIRDIKSSTVTTEYSGRFLNREIRNEFLSYLDKK
ncbi:GTP cyclohydrolase I FolE [soil metagenome]